MDENSFIAQQLRGWLYEKVNFEPFEISLINGLKLFVSTRNSLTMLSGGILYYEQDGTHRIFGYDAILCLQTIFEDPD